MYGSPVTGKGFVLEGLVLSLRDADSHRRAEPWWCYSCNQMRPILKPNSAACHSEAKTWEKSVGGESFFVQEVSNLGKRWTDVLRPSSGFWLRDKGFKTTRGRRATGFMASSRRILRLVGIKAKFQALLIFQFQPACICMIVVSSFHLAGDPFSVKTIWECVCHTFICIFHGTRSSMTLLLWLVYSLKCNQFLTSFYIFTFSYH